MRSRRNNWKIKDLICTFFLGSMLKFHTFLFQVHIMMLNPNVLPQNQQRKHEKCLQITDGAQLHHWYLLLPVFSVDYHMWMSLRTSWSVFLSVCFTSASWRGLLQPETNSPPLQHPQRYTHTPHTHFWRRWYRQRFLPCASALSLAHSSALIPSSSLNDSEWIQPHFITLGLYFTLKCWFPAH